MDRITLKNYRCFQDEQSARLAPLTFLVGGNSTGKTSFLALIRALWDVAFAEEVPDFREEPYNLGSFREIAHSRGARGSKAATFEAGFEYPKARRREAISFQASFEERSSDPFPTKRHFACNGIWVEILDLGGNGNTIRFGDSIGRKYPSVESNLYSRDETRLFSLRSAEVEYRLNSTSADSLGVREARTITERGHRGSYRTGDSAVESITVESFRELARHFRPPHRDASRGRPFASAPVRSRPLRTYDPARPSADPEGGYIPTYLANVSRRGDKPWQDLKSRLEEFGQVSGLFDEISIKDFGKSEGTPFQVQVRKFSESGRMKGQQRNLIDVGYGVSQVLPLLTELFRPDASSIFLLQQPEVHLHPSAQAALGSLFCSIAGQDRQLIVETHSDYILDRVRMDIRDQATHLKPEDVSILYFEPGDLSVQIHSIRMDEMGNVLDAPPSYRQFFTKEVRRSIGIGR